MENKLKILSAHLPYNTKVKNNCGQIRELAMVDAENNCIASTETNGMIPIDSSHVNGSGFKPILFPLEDLTKPITIGGKTFKVEDEIFAMCNVGLSSNAKKYWKENFIENIKNTPYTQLSYEVVQKLLEWKFNVFNLPEDEYVKVTDEFNPYK